MENICYIDIYILMFLIILIIIYILMSIKQKQVLKNLKNISNEDELNKFCNSNKINIMETSNDTIKTN